MTIRLCFCNVKLTLFRVFHSQVDTKFHVTLWMHSMHCGCRLLIGQWCWTPTGSSGDSEDCVIGSQGLCVPTQKSYSSSETLKAFDHHQDQTRWATASSPTSFFTSQRGRRRRREWEEWKGRRKKGEESQGIRGRRYGRRNSVRSL